MENTINQKASFIVSETILNQDGKFTMKDILDKVKPMVSTQFETPDKLETYISRKLNSMCDYGLIGKTSMYYFSL